MTISTEHTPLSYNGDGSTVNFAITWKYFAKSHVVATLRSAAGVETVWALTTNYTLTAAGVEAGGTLTAVVAPATGEKLVITLEPPNTQDASLPLGGAFPSPSVEDGLDLSAQRDSKFKNLLNRTFRVPVTDTQSGSNLEFPIDSSRASKYLSFDVNGKPIAVAGTTNTPTVSSFMETLLDDASAAAARATLLIETKTTVASATTPDIWTASGHMIDYTGTATATGFAAAPQAGANRTLVCAGAAVFTAGANMLIAGVASGSNFTATATDLLYVIAITTTQFLLIPMKYDGSAVVAGGPVPRNLENAGLSVAMAANAVTIALKSADGNDPSASNAVKISFRNATLTNGQSSRVSVTGALSVAISSGSTGGTVSAQASRIWVAAMLVSGAVELAWFNSLSGLTIKEINEGGVISTTAEGGAGGADSTQTWYSTTARANVPFTILGYFDSTQTTAGTWAAAAAAIIVNPKSRPGMVVQEQYNQTGAVATGTTVMPIDDTIPQNTEGDQYMSQAITPIFAGNLLQIDHVGMYTNTAGNNFGVALFQDSVADAIAVVSASLSVTGYVQCVKLTHRMVATLIVATTFKVRAGPAAAHTTTFNGTAAARLFGGTMASSMLVKEIMT